MAATSTQALSGVPNAREPIAEKGSLTVSRAWFYFFQVVFNRTTPTGGVIQFAGVTLPNGFLACDGSAVSRETYTQLFSVIGITFGAGDGVRTFNVPTIGPVGGVQSLIKT